MSQNETEKLLAMLDSMEEAIATNHWPSNDPAGSASIEGVGPWDANAGATPEPQGGWDAGTAPAWNGQAAAAAPPPVPRPDAPPITAAFRSFPDPVPSREGYTPTRGKTSEVLSSIQWVPES